MRIVDDASQSPFVGPGEMVTATLVARRYDFGNRSKVQIAGELRMTRFKVARLLELARASGIVNITVVGAGSLEPDLSERMCERFGLRHAVVVNPTRGNDAETREHIGEVAADFLSEITTPNDVLGSGWARVVLAMPAKTRGLRPAGVSSSPARSPDRMDLGYKLSGARSRG